METLDQLHYSGSPLGLVDIVAGSQGCQFTCADSSIPLVVSLVWSQEYEGGPHCLSVEGPPFWINNRPRVFTKLLALVAAHLHLQG